jgi:hypothetical protein
MDDALAIRYSNYLLYLITSESAVKTRLLQEEIGLLKSMVKRDLLSKLFGK